MPYLKRMLYELAEMKYQFRTMVLRACNYGDPQIRPRFIIFASRYDIPLPLPPRHTHADPYKLHNGLGSTTAPWVMPGDVLELLTRVPDGTYPNMDDRKSSEVKPGNDKEYSVLDPHRLSSAILASGPAIFHYKVDKNGKRQCLSVRDEGAIQSYPNDYEFLGNTLAEKYKQVGNSVPVGLATALARAAAEVLRFVYQGEEDGVNSHSDQEEEGDDMSGADGVAVDEDTMAMDDDGDAESLQGDQDDVDDNEAQDDETPVATDEEEMDLEKNNETGESVIASENDQRAEEEADPPTDEEMLEDDEWAEWAATETLLTK